MQPKPQTDEERLDSITDFGQPTSVIPQNDKIIGIAHIMATTEFFLNEMIQSIQHHIRKELAGLVASGALRVRETVAQGIDSAPQAFLGLLSGRNFGKQLVKLI